MRGLRLECRRREGRTGRKAESRADGRATGQARRGGNGRVSPPGTAESGRARHGHAPQVSEHEQRDRASRPRRASGQEDRAEDENERQAGKADGDGREQRQIGHGLGGKGATAQRQEGAWLWPVGLGVLLVGA